MPVVPKRAKTLKLAHPTHPAPTWSVCGRLVVFASRISNILTALAPLQSLSSSDQAHPSLIPFFAPLVLRSHHHQPTMRHGLGFVAAALAVAQCVSAGYMFEVDKATITECGPTNISWTSGAQTPLKLMVFVRVVGGVSWCVCMLNGTPRPITRARERWISPRRLSTPMGVVLSLGRCLVSGQLPMATEGACTDMDRCCRH